MSLIRADPEEMEKTKMEKRVFLIVLDSFGIGAEPDAAAFGDEGTNTLGAIAKHPNFNCPNLQKLGLFNINGVTAGEKTAAPTGSFARLQEQSMGKDTTIGHWEIAGVVSPKPLPTFPDGFPPEIIRNFEKLTGRKVICNKPYSGTQLLLDYGREHVETGALMVYTSADSVFQVAAHEDIVPIEELYHDCELAREMGLADELLTAGPEACIRYLISDLPVSYEKLRATELPVKVLGAGNCKPGKMLAEGFPTASGKFELYSLEIAKIREQYPDCSLDCLPVYREPICAAEQEKYPFTLCSGPRIPGALHSRLHGVPWARSLRPDATADLNPADAEG